MYDIIVIGCGVAGMTAALYARRNGMTVLVIEADTIGGQISKSPKVENFPTIPSIEGMELADKLFEQITEKGAEFELDTVKEIVKDGKEFTRLITMYPGCQETADFKALVPIFLFTVNICCKF